MFKVNKAVTTYGAVLVMAIACNTVTISIVLNVWLSTRIVASFQMNELRDMKERVLREVKPALKPQVGSSLLTKKRNSNTLLEF